MRQDLEMWETFFEHFNGVRVFHDCVWTSNCFLIVQAWDLVYILQENGWLKNGQNNGINCVTLPTSQF